LKIKKAVKSNHLKYPYPVLCGNKDKRRGLYNRGILLILIISPVLKLSFTGMCYRKQAIWSYSETIYDKGSKEGFRKIPGKRE